LASVAAPTGAPQGSRFARPALPAAGLDRPRLARRLERHALMAQRERYAAPHRNDSADKFAPFSRWSLPAARRHVSSSKISTKTTAFIGFAARRPLRLLAASSRRKGRPAKKKPSKWTVTDDWPADVPITEAEIEVFEAWFGDLFDELFSTRH
jgi:hypothetical protein